MDAYCHAVELHEIYNGAAQIIQDVLHGRTHFDAYEQDLICTITTARDQVTFRMKVFESKRWKRVHKNNSLNWMDNRKNGIIQLGL